MEAFPLEDEPEEQPEEQEEPAPPETEHGDDLSRHIHEQDLATLASQLFADFRADERSLDDNRKIIEKGLKLLGVTLEELTEPFEGACSAVYPLMLEAAVQFQARAIAELFPSSGPVKTQIIGSNTHERVQQAARVKEFMNYQLTEVMDEYFDELDQMLFTLPIVGSCFKKLYYDPSLGRPVSRLVPVENFVVAYHVTDLRTCGRYTHVIPMEEVELKKLQASGFYRDDVMPVSEPSEEKKPVQTQVHKIEGRTETPEAGGNHYNLLEMHVDLDLPGFEDRTSDNEKTGIALPYVVTLDKQSQKILSIRRNWAEDDPFRRRLQWFVHYKYLPGLGFYGYGLVHILGNLQRSATAILRSLVDAGQYATLPAFFKARGARVSEGNKPVSFGEYRDVDNFGDDLTKAIIPVPTKEPSITLFQLLQSIVDAARRLASIADINVGDNSNDEQPVGTTLAMLEQAVKVMSAIHKRLHKAQREELRILKRINRTSLPQFYPYEVEGATREVYSEDFGRQVDVLPVSDPNVFSETQRIMRAQAIGLAAQQLPAVHNMHEVAYRIHEAIGTPKIDDVLVPDMGPKPMDPATENYAILHGKPVMAYAYQDHDAHIQSHMAFMSDPQMGGNPVVQQVILPAMMAHIADHKAHAYRLQIQAATGVPLNPPPHYDPSNPNRPDDYHPLPPLLENEIARKQAMAGQQIAQNAQIAAQAQQNQQVLQNPMYQLEVQKLQIEKQDSDTKRMDVMLKHNSQKDQVKAQIDMTKAAHSVQMEREKHAANLSAQFSQQQLEARRLALQSEMQQRQAEMEMIQQAQQMAQQQAADQQRNAAQVQAAKIGLQTQAAKGAVDIHIQKQKNEAQLSMDRERHDMEMQQQKQEHQQAMKLQNEKGKADVQVAKAQAQAYKSGKMAPKGGAGGSKSKSSSRSKGKK